MQTTKETICSDLHNILYRLALQSADSWQMRVDMAKVVLSHHGVKFKDSEEICFFAMCKVYSCSETEFEAVAFSYLDFATWEQNQKDVQVFGTVLLSALNDAHYAVTALAEHKDDVTLVAPINS